MTQEEAVKFAWKLIKSKEKHQDYKRVVDLAQEYMILITGEEMEKLLIRFVQRESVEMFAQRIALTNAITPAVANSIMKPFYKVSRNDKVKVRHDFKDESKNKAVADMLSGFSGAKRRKSKGLNHWLKTRYVDLVFSDPNSWIVTTWDTVSLTETPQPRPFEITAKQAFNFEIVNDELKWLFAGFEDDYFYYELSTDGVTAKKKLGQKWILYQSDYTVVVRTIDPKALSFEGYEIGANDTLVEDGAKTFLVSVFEPKLGFAPAFRVGYIPDIYTKSRTCVNPFHAAMPFFRKSIKTVSELDISMTLHAFPQKLQYIQKCKGEGKGKTCHSGRINGTTAECSMCKGTGYKIHTTGQDAILLPLPEDKEQFLDLDKMIAYKSPPIELIKFQDEYTKGLKQEAHLAVFNSQIFIAPELQVAKTATEVDDNMQSVYDTLEPYTEKISEIYKEQVFIDAILAAVPNPEEGENIHQFPGDLKLKTTTILLNELKLVNESGAPSFMRDVINDDLAQIIYVGDDVGLLKHKTMRKFFPFNGKTPDEIAFLLSSQFVSEDTKILYSNFEAIFKDIELEDPTFWFMKSTAKQWDIVNAKIEEFAAELEPEAPVIKFGNAPDPGTGDPDPDDDPEGGSNPGGEE